MHRFRPILGTLLAVGMASCTGTAPDSRPMPLTRLTTDRNYLRDGYGRYVFLHGVNTSGSTKVPVAIDPKTGVPSYVGTPFPIESARERMKALSDMGIRTFRFLLMWEGIEPEARGKYDTAYLDYVRQMVQIADEFGIQVLLDMHQDMFSRHLSVKYNETPKYGTPGSLESTLLALLPPYTDQVRGDGAPRWAVEACLQEKNLSSPNWGKPRLLSNLGAQELADLMEVYKLLNGGEATGPIPEWVDYALKNLPEPFPVTETSDVLPFTNWGIAAALSYDLSRCFACLFAGDKAFPNLKKDGKSVKDWLQDAYAAAWAQVADRVKDLPNVIGYDIINEPVSNFLVLSAVAGFAQAGGPEGSKSVLVSLLGKENGELFHRVLMGLRILPPDGKPETLKEWGMDGIDLFAVLGFNVGFDRNYMKPFYEKVGKAILEKDPRAVIFIEPTMNIGLLFGSGIAGGMWDLSMTRPDLPHVVYAPHNYADIYPFLGFNQPPRDLKVEEVRYRDYQEALENTRKPAAYSLGNIPVVFGEFGTYFNFNGIDASEANGYAVSSHILDNYYEAFDRMFQSRIQWCYSPDNDRHYGDRWNKEDFSILDFNQKWRSQAAWARPYARALAGKPKSMHFWSDLHYFDPTSGIPNPEREFEVRYERKETDAPTEIVVPEVQYPDGFYVWVSDGFCTYDADTHTLFHFPTADEPGTIHSVRLMPPLPHVPQDGWGWFFRKDQAISRH